MTFVIVHISFTVYVLATPDLCVNHTLNLNNTSERYLINLYLLKRSNLNRFFIEKYLK